MERIVNGNTSVIQTDGSIPIVYVSTTTLTDHFVTIVDMVGAVPVHVSTTAGVTLTGGATDVYIQQPFGYLSLAAVSTNQWSIANQDPFSVNISTIRALDTNLLKVVSTTATLVSTSSLLSPYMTLGNIAVSAGSVGYNRLARTSMSTSSNVLANSLQSRSTNTASANMLDISGLSAFVTGGAQLGGPVQIAQNFLGNTVAASNVRISSIAGNTVSTATAQAGSWTTQTVTTSTATAASLFLGSTSIIFTPIAAGSYIQTPSATSGTFLSFETLTSSISASVIYGPMHTIQLGSAAIVNPSGSITLSSLTAQSIGSQNVSGVSMTTGDMSVSSITMNTMNPTPTTLVAATGDLIQIDSSWSISANSLQTSTMRTENLSLSNVSLRNLIANDLSANTLAPATFSAQSTMTLEGPEVYVPLAPFVANQVLTSTAQSGPLTISSLSGLQTLTSDTLTIRGLQAVDVSANAVLTNRASTVSMYAKNVTLGTQIPVNPGAPYISVESYSQLDQPPFQYATGSGTYTDPYRAVNTAPTLIYISLYNPSGQTLYLNIKFRHTNLPPPNSGLNGGVDAYINGNLIYNVLNIYQEELVQSTQLDLNMANYPLQSVNPTTGDNTPYVVWSVASSSVTTDEITMWISNNLNAVDEAAAPVVDTTAGITIRQGIMQWPSTIYATSIINQYNDIETRSVLYTGSLQNVSDRALKKNIVDADLSTCVAATQTMLHTYEYIPAFASTFQTHDRRRLGLLTTEVAEVFPKSIRTATILGTETQVLSTDQMRYAHIGATKYLIAEVARLRKVLSERA